MNKYGEVGSASIDRPPTTRLPFKESIEVANEKLEKLLNKLYNFDSHLFPTPTTAASSPEAIPSSDFADMIDRTHSLIDRCELALDRIRDRF